MNPLNNNSIFTFDNNHLPSGTKRAASGDLENERAAKRLKSETEITQKIEKDLKSDEIDEEAAIIDKKDEPWLPDDLWLGEIFPKLMPTKYFPESSIQGLHSCFFVSKKWSELALRVHAEWVDATSNFHIYGCKTTEEAIQCIIRRQLRRADLSEFDDVTNEQLIKLQEGTFNLQEGASNLLELRLNRCTTVGIPVFNKLRTLSLLNCAEISEENLAQVLPELKHLQNLELTYLKETITGDKFLEVLTKLENLTDLNLQGSQIPSKNLVGVLSKVQNLKRLNLSECNLTEYDKSAKLFENFKTLTHLDLAESEIDDQTISKILHYTTSLEYLDLFLDHQIGEKFARALGQLKDLKLLNIAECANIPSDELVKSIVQLTNLRNLSIGGCSQVTNTQFKATLPKLVNLEKLHLGGCHITEEGLWEISKLENLKKLHLPNCPDITAEMLIKVLPRLKKLASVVLHYLIMEDELEVMRLNFPDIDFEVDKFPYSESDSASESDHE